MGLGWGQIEIELDLAHRRGHRGVEILRQIEIDVVRFGLVGGGNSRRLCLGGAVQCSGDVLVLRGDEFVVLHRELAHQFPFEVHAEIVFVGQVFDGAATTGAAEAGFCGAGASGTAAC